MGYFFNMNKIIEQGIAAALAYYRMVAIVEKKFSKSSAFVSGIDSPYLNVFFDLYGEVESQPDLIKAVSDFFSEYNTRWAWLLAPGSSYQEVKIEKFSLLEEAPMLHFDLKKTLPSRKDSIDIIEIKDTTLLVDWVQPIMEAFKMKSNDHRFLELNVKLFQKEEKRLKHFMIYRDGEVAASGTIFLSRQSVVVHNLATHKKYQKQGLATALMLFMMDYAKKLNFQDCFLESSAEALSLYQSIGFEKKYTTLFFVKTR